MLQKLEYNLSELPEAAQYVIKNATSKILLFNADMGVGKTTLIKEICRKLGVIDTISSPTYSLVNEYESNEGVIYHFDFYRIKEEDEAYHIGFEEYLDSNAWVFIEWPEKILRLLPETTTTININLQDSQKRILSLSNANC